MRFTLNCEGTETLGKILGECLPTGTFLALSGDLGGGKTTFTKALARGLGFPGEVTSPTFNLLHIYEGGRAPLYHFDLYRIKNPEELMDIGFEEYIESDGITAAEWAEYAGEALPERRIELHFEKAGETERAVEILPVQCELDAELERRLMELQ